MFYGFQTWKFKRQTEGELVDWHSQSDDENKQYIVEQPLCSSLSPTFSIETGNDSSLGKLNGNPTNENTAPSRIFPTASPLTNSDHSTINIENTHRSTLSHNTDIPYLSYQGEASSVNKDLPSAEIWRSHSTSKANNQQPSQLTESTDYSPGHQMHSQHDIQSKHQHNLQHSVQSKHQPNIETKRNRKVYLSSPDLELRSTSAVKKLIDFIGGTADDNADNTAYLTTASNTAASSNPNQTKRCENEVETPSPPLIAPNTSTAAETTSSTDSADNKKNKKVEFSKTEVHFVAAEPGKIKIVETKEKPPPAVSPYCRRRRNGGGNGDGRSRKGDHELRWSPGNRENGRYKCHNNHNHRSQESDYDENADDEHSQKLIFAGNPASTFDKGLTVKISSSKSRNENADAKHSNSTNLNRVMIKGASGFTTKISFRPEGTTVVKDDDRSDATVVPPSWKYPHNLIRGPIPRSPNAVPRAAIATIYHGKN